MSIVYGYTYSTSVVSGGTSKGEGHGWLDLIFIVLVGVRPRHLRPHFVAPVRRRPLAHRLRATPHRLTNRSPNGRGKGASQNGTGERGNGGAQCSSG